MVYSVLEVIWSSGMGTPSETQIHGCTYTHTHTHIHRERERERERKRERERERERERVYIPLNSERG